MSGLASLHQMAALKLRELRAGNQSFIFYLFIVFYFLFLFLFFSEF